MKIFCKLLCLLSVFFLLITSPAFAQTTPAFTQTIRDSIIDPIMPSIKVFSKEVSRSLDIAKIPTAEPIPLIVGGYWKCEKKFTFEICDFKVVACTDDQSFCVETP